MIIREMMLTLFCGDCQAIYETAHHHTFERELRAAAARDGWTVATIGTPGDQWVIDRCPTCTAKHEAPRAEH